MAKQPEGTRGEGKSASAGRPRWRIPLIVALLAVGAAGAVYAVVVTAGREVTDNAYVHAEEYAVSSRVPGTVVEVLVDTNQAVHAGELLVRLDPEGPTIQLRMARLAVETARMHLEEAQIAERAAEAEERLIEAKLDQARVDLGRAEILWKKRTIPKEQYDRSQTEHRVLVAQKRVAEAKKALAKARVDTSRTAQENAQAQLARAELNLSYTEIHSPADGYVARKSVETGRVVQPGVPLLSVVDLSDIWVEANFKEVQLGHIRPGLTAEITLDAFPDRTFRGHVDTIRAGTGSVFSLFPPENATGNWVKVVQRVAVKVLFEDYRPEPAGPVLRAGMSASVKVVLEDGPRLPRLLSSLGFQ